MLPRHWLLLTVALIAVTVRAETTKAPDIVKPKASTPDEPLARELSLVKTAEFLDNAAVTWTRERKCGACHTNYPYILGRSLLAPKGETPAGVAEVRGFFEERAKNWDTAKPRWDTEVVATAATLAMHDALTTGKLHAVTRAALDRMWIVQKPHGAWNWLKCNWPPFEHDDYYGAVFAAVALGMAPDGYAQGDSAKEGMAKLRKYLKDTPAPDLHHKTWLLWASTKLAGLMTKEQQEATVKELLAIQRPDGGWSLAAYADWQGVHGKPNDTTRPSDGYATGLAVYVLRQAGLPAGHDKVQAGVKWLRGNQRESGRWFTYSLNSDKTHYITNAGTSFAVLALKACE